jgi:hypothetical protein
VQVLTSAELAAARAALPPLCPVRRRQTSTRKSAHAPPSIPMSTYASSSTPFEPMQVQTSTQLAAPFRAPAPLAPLPFVAPQSQATMRHTFSITAPPTPAPTAARTSTHTPAPAPAPTPAPASGRTLDFASDLAFRPTLAAPQPNSVLPLTVSLSFFFLSKNVLLNATYRLHCLLVLLLCLLLRLLLRNQIPYCLCL